VFWILWPAVILTIVVLAALLSRHIYGDFVEVRMDLRRGNLIGLTAVAFVPPICLTILWRRMRGRRHSQSEERRR
jgi:Na+/proline symporter